MFACVASFSYIPVCMAGAITMGQRTSSIVDVSKSSAIPNASFAITFAVAGAITTTSASCAMRTCRTLSGSSNTSVRTGLPESAANVASPTNLVAPAVITTCTSAPAWRSLLVRMAALYAAIPPVTPRRTRLPDSGDLLDADTLGPLEDDLALGDLLHRDRQRLVLQSARLDERRHELAAALAELAVVRVDLARPLRRQDHQRVLGIHPLGAEEVVDLRFDHRSFNPSARFGRTR